MILNTLKRSTATPMDILAIIRDEHRHQCESDPGADPDIDLTLESTVQDWRYACDLVEWKPLAEALNAQWEVDIPLSTWKRALTPPKKRQLGDVCELLALHAAIESVDVPTIFGRKCEPAGVFFAIRELLARDGADVDELRPSSLLSEFAVDYFRTIAGPISHLAPGQLPAIKIDHPAYDRPFYAFTICLIGLLGSLLVVSFAPFLWIAFLPGLMFCWIWTLHAARYTKPATVTFGDLRTIRDVCVTMAPGIRT